MDNKGFASYVKIVGAIMLMLICIMIIEGCGQKPENIDLKQEISLESVKSTFPEEEQYNWEDEEVYYFDDDEPVFSNYISNINRITDQTEIELPIIFFSTVTQAVDSYLQSMGYYEQPLYVYKNYDGFYRRGTCFHMKMQIGETGDILSGVYHIYDQEYEFFIIKEE